MDLIKNIYLNLAIELGRVIFIVLFCHFAGDYLFQTDYMARKKGKDWWVMTAHCFCYCLPFLAFFGVRWQLLFILVVHFIVDYGKCKGWYGLFFDQYFHILAAMTYIFPVLADKGWRAISV